MSTVNTDELYMHRCLELAKLGFGNVAPNPLVGAVLVHQGRIIGEGYHQEYGQAHAEVNCLQSVMEEDAELISHSTLYVSLEPCNHYGKTPPCTDLILANKIRKVVIGISDPFPQVNGKGIEKLLNAGVEVTTSVLEQECSEINIRFFTFHTRQRPYVVLKWAQTSNGKIAGNTNDRLMVTNELTNRLVHKWRSEEAAILVGSNTVLCDNPALNLRLWKGKKPVRLIIDRELAIPAHMKVYDQTQETVVFNCKKEGQDASLRYWLLNRETSIITQVLKACKDMNIQSVLVEGGAKLLQSFINEGYWDEARIITNTNMYVNEGLAAPVLNSMEKTGEKTILTDTINYYRNNGI